MLLDGARVHVDEEDPQKGETREDSIPEITLIDDMGGVVADLSGAHIHVEAAKLHGVIGPDDDLSNAEAILLRDGTIRKEDRKLQELPMMGQPIGHLVLILTKRERKSASVLLLIGRVGVLLLIQEIFDDLEGKFVSGGGFRHGRNGSSVSSTEQSPAEWSEYNKTREVFP